MLRSAQAAAVAVTRAVSRAASSAGTLTEASGKLGTPGRSAVAGVRVVVFGNTGFLGRYVVNKLGQIGAQVVIPYRGDEHDYRHMKLMGDLGQIVPVELDARSPKAIREVVDGADVVVNLVGINAETRNWSFVDTHVHLAGAIAEAAADAGVDRLVHVSHMAASAQAPSAFLRSKAAGEAAVRRAFASATIVKPASLIGIEDQLLNKMGEFAKNFEFLPLVGDGSATIRPVTVGDVASGIVRAIDDRAAAGQDYYLGGEAMTRRELSEYVFRLIRCEPRFVPVPVKAMAGLGSIIEKFPNAVLTEDQVLSQTASETIPAGAKTFDDLNLRVTAIEPLALQVLRRYRPPRVWAMPLDNEGDIHLAHKRQ